MGVTPYRFTAAASAPAASSTRTISRSSCRAAQWSAVVPSASRAFTAAGRLASARTAARLPALTASLSRISGPPAARVAVKRISISPIFRLKPEATGEFSELTIRMPASEESDRSGAFAERFDRRAVVLRDRQPDVADRRAARQVEMAVAVLDSPAQTQQRARSGFMAVRVA